MPRTEQFGIGQKIDELFLDVLETLRTAMYSPIQDKIVLLGKAIIKTDSLRFFLQLSWDAKLLTDKQFSLVAEHIEETGKMIGGWKKGLIIKTSTLKNAEENKE